MSAVSKARHALKIIEDPKVIQDHASAVRSVADKVWLCYNEKRPFRIFHGHTNSTRQNVLRKNESIDISKLNRVLRVDLEKKRVLAEPNVPMDSLVQATLKHGLIPPVVPEFPGITVGGSFAGTAGESSSFKHGFFDKTVTSAEIVLPDGTLTTISEERDAELFRKMPSTMGTIGVTTAVEIQLMDAKRYVLSTYHPVGSMQEATSIIERETSNPDLDFLDGIMFSPTSGAVITGRLINEAPKDCSVQGFSRPWDPWYYVHVQDRISSSLVKPTKPIIEAIPIAEYFFRWDRGGFWVGRSAFQYFHMPFHRLTRWFLDDFLHTRMLFKALHASKNVISYVVQDCALPYPTAAEFIAYTDKNIPFYPLWLCPLPKQDSRQTFHPHHYTSDGEMQHMLNIGFWGFGPRKHANYLTANRALEEKLTSLGGRKWLYSQTYYTSSEFWALYPKEWYESLRQRYNANHLPDVWQKVRVDVEKEKMDHAGWKIRLLKVWPVAGVYGLLKAIWSGEWRIPRRVRIAEMDVPASATAEGEGKKEK